MSNYSNEIQIEIDDVYACPGNCPGCILSKLERKTDKPDMPNDILVKSIEKLKSYVPTLKNLEKINLTFGVADHFMMSNEYLAHTYNLGASLIESANLKNPENGVFFSASMIGKHDIIMEKVNFLHDLSKKRGVPLYIIAVLDPKHLHHHKFAETYKNNITKSHELLKRVDLSINLNEESLSLISPKELFNFALEHKFSDVTLNWTPSYDNIAFVYMDQEKLANWLLEFDNLISKTDKTSAVYRQVIMRTISNLRHKNYNSDYSFQENLEYNLPELVYKNLHIDDQGNIFPKYEAIGDVSHSPRLGFEPIGNVTNDSSISEMIEKSLFKIKKYITKQFLNEPCNSCEFNQYCTNSGFHVYNHIINKSATKNLNTSIALNNNIEKFDCIHVAKALFKHYEPICLTQNAN